MIRLSKRTSNARDVLNSIEAHIKEPFLMVYSLKPLLSIVLLVEFLEKLAKRGNRYKNRCIVLKGQLLGIGHNFVREVKDEEQLKFFAD